MLIKRKTEKMAIAAGFGLAMLLLCIVGIASYLSIQNLTENRQLVVHTRQILKELDLTLSELVGDNLQPQPRLDEIEPLIAKRITLLQQSINLWQQHKLDASAQIVIIGVIGIGYGLSFSLLFWLYFLLQKQLRVSAATIKDHHLAVADLQKRTQMLDFANDTIIIYDLDNRITYWNQGAERLYGWTKEEAVGKDIHTLLQTVFPKPLEEIRAECRNWGHWEGELTHIRRDRTPIIVVSRWTLQQDEQDNPTAILEINYNITEQKRAEEALRQSEERWQLAVLGSNDGIWDFNLKTNEVFYSSRWKEMLGYEDGEIDNRYEEWVSRIHPDDLDRILPLYQGHLAKKIPFYANEHRLRCQDGTYKWILTRGQALWDEEGNPIRIVGSHSDISDRKRIEDILRISQERYALAVNVGQVGVWDWNIQTNEIYIDSVIKEALGFTDMEIQNNLDEWHRLIYPDDREKVIAATEAHLQGLTPDYQIEHRRLHKDGSIRWFLSRGTAFQDASDRPYRMTGTDSDITERKQTEEALEQLTAELKRSNQELEQFAYVASHDLQEPLRAVMGYTQLLEQEYQQYFDESAQEYMAYIVDGAARMRQLIQDLLTYSRVGTRGGKFAPTDCNVILRRVLDNLQIAITESQAVITYDSLPTVLADPTQLVQLWQNLIGNAIKFCRERQPQIHITAVENGDWLFQVRDNGIGIKPQYLDRIFEIFKRLHTRKEFPGTGIGLAICKKIVERHGGSIWVESQPGVGTTFYFTIPSHK